MGVEVVVAGMAAVGGSTVEVVVVVLAVLAAVLAAVVAVKEVVVAGMCGARRS